MVEGRPDKRGGLPRGEGSNLSSPIACQARSVVGRTILQGKAGSVTLFAFDQGEGSSEHTAPFDALVYILEGEADVNVSGTDNRLGPGDGIILAARRPHSLRAPKRFKMFLIIFRSA
jgi:quercetin dioxygenase-like cupin family protein